MSKHRMNKRWIVALCLALLGGAAGAASLEEVAITAERLDDGVTVPAVTMERRADFLVQRVRLINDTRAPDGRTKEIYATIGVMVDDAARHRDMALGQGSGFFVPMDLAARDLKLERVPGRPGTSQTDIYVKVAIAPGDDVARAAGALCSFIESARVSGRTEVEPAGDISLSLVSPEQYRLEIVERVAADMKLVHVRLGGQRRMELSGLERRVRWERSGLAELRLFVPYELRATECGQRQPA